jgi:two-component system chemotaxis response regulator CheY
MQVTHSDDEAASMTTRPLRILVADDVETVRFTMVIEMRDQGWEVEEAGTGSDALDMLRARPFDVLVTDIWMPNMDGISLIKAIRRAQPDLRVFAVSGGGPGMSLASAGTLAEVWGAEKLFVKPFDVADLIAAIRA